MVLIPGVIIKEDILCDTEIESIVLEGNHKSLLLIYGILYRRLSDDGIEFYNDYNINKEYVSSKLSLCFIPLKMKLAFFGLSFWNCEFYALDM